MRNGAPARTALLSGMMLGAVAGFSFLVFPPVGLVVAALGLILMSPAGRRLVGIGGLLFGIGGTWFALFGRVKLSCVAEQGCATPTIDLYLWVSIGLLAAGIAMALIARRRDGVGPTAPG